MAYHNRGYDMDAYPASSYPAQGYPPPSAQGYPPPSAQGYPPPSAQGYPPPSAQGYPPPSGQSYPPRSSHAPPGGGSGGYPSSPHPSNVVVQPGPDEGITRKIDAYLVLSCAVCWFCNLLFGGIAFGLAMLSRDASYSGDIEKAHRLAKWSLVMSLLGAVITSIFVIVIITLMWS